MQTLKDRFNYQARQTYLDLLVLWFLLLLLIARYQELESHIAYQARKLPPSFRPR